MATNGYLGIDAGTQGLSIVFADEAMNVLGVGEGNYEMVGGLGDGCYEQAPQDWTAAIVTAMADLRQKLSAVNVQPEILSIGISGQMHGEVLCDDAGAPLCATRLWCDSRNEAEGAELTKLLGVKMPKRITAARWLWTVRERASLAKQTKHVTTPAGWLAFQLTGEWKLGIGDAAGMFPIDQATLDYDEQLLAAFDTLVVGNNVAQLKSLLPQVRTAGEDAGALNAAGAALLGLAEGIPVAAAEGDQPAALAGSLISQAGMVSLSFGTSVCANSVGDRSFAGVDPAIDHFCAPDGKPINMVFMRNGTTFMNCVVEMFGMAHADAGNDGFAQVMPWVLASPADCGGLLALPFIDDEPGLQVSRGGSATIVGMNGENVTPGNVAKAAFLATVFNLRKGSEVLDQQGYPRTELVLSGGLTKTPELGQVVADVMRADVILLNSAEEGTAWGAALLANFRHRAVNHESKTWSEFLSEYATNDATRFTPSAEEAKAYDAVYARYLRLMDARMALENAVLGDEA